MNVEFAIQRERLGLIYGLICGFAFAFFTWGVDAWLLFQAHAAFWWIKLLLGMLICLAAAGLAGWWTIRTGSHWMALLLWGGLAYLLSRMLTWIPVTAAPYLMEQLDPGIASFLRYAELADVGQFHVVGLIITGLAAVITGLLEINLVDQAQLSPYGSGPVTMLAVCLLLFGLAGGAADHLVNTNFREPVQAVDHLIQFAADNQGKEVPAETARKLHLSAVRNITDLLHRPRRLILVAFDGQLGRMDLLVNFQGSLVKCTAIYAQPTDCVRVDAAP